MSHLEPIIQYVGSLPEIEIDAQKTALICIDLQYFDASPDHGVFEGTRDDNAYYFDRLDNTVIPNVARLQRVAREQRIEVMHVKIAALTNDGRDRGRRHAVRNMLSPRDSIESTFLPEVCPDGDEIVFSKTSSGMFATTNADLVLRNMGLDTLIFVGVATNQCVETSVRVAADLGYNVLLVEDGCATISKDSHHASIKAMDDAYAVVKSTDDVIKQMNEDTI